MSDRPDPMTPPESDLRGMPYMQLDIGRLFDSDLYALSTGDEFKAALSLWCKAFLQVPAGSLPSDERLLAYLSGARGSWPKVREMALHGWVECSDGRLYHRVVAEYASHAWAARISHRTRTAAARAAKAAARSPSSSTPPPPVTISVTESVTDVVTNVVAFSVTGSVTDAVTGSKGEGEGEGEGIRRIEKKEDTELRSDAAFATSLPARDHLWSAGLSQLRALTGMPEGKARSMIGRWCREMRDDCSGLNAILAEACDLRPIDPLPWLVKAVAARAKPEARKSTLDKMSDRWSLPTLADLDAWAEENHQPQGLLQ